MIRPLRDALVPVILCGVAAFFPVSWVVALFFVIGYPHFLLAYVYRYRANPPQRIYLVIAPFVFGACLIAYLVFYGAFLPLFLITGISFAVHFAVDEFFLHGDKILGWRWLTLGAFIALYSLLMISTTVDGYTFMNVYVPYIFLIALGVRLFVGGSTVSSGEKYLALVACLILGVSVFGSAVQVLGAVIFLHIYNWYDWSAKRSAGKPGGSKRYWRDVVLSMFLFVFFYMLYEYGDVKALSVFYDPMSYYAWSLVHMLLSLRLPVVISTRLFSTASS